MRLVLPLLAACAPGAAPDGPGDTDPADTDDVRPVRDPLPACPTFGAGVSSGVVEEAALNEISGIVASRRHPGTWWVHNDSGDGPRAYALDDGGALRAAITIDGAIAADWEDLGASGSGEDAALWLGDIGDNARLRQVLLVWRVPEPDPALGDATVDASLVRLSYADGPRDAEALWVDPDSGALVVLTKESGSAGLYVAPAEDEAVLERVADVPFGTGERPGSPLVTAADVTPDGRWIAVRTYTHVWVWRRPRGWTLAEAFAEPACPAAAEPEPQGEAIAWSLDGRSYRTVSEDVQPPMWRFDRVAATE